jgi:hypothetical protein
MTNPYQPPDKSDKPKRRWLTLQFVLEFMVGCVIGFVLLCVAITFFVVSLLPEQKETVLTSRSGH